MKHRDKSTLEERFEDYVLRLVDVPCWLWTASLDTRGYPQLYMRRQGKRRVNVPRWSYEHWRGSIPEGLELDHLCRVRSCVNPYHLEPVSHKENVLRGEGVAAHRARLTHCIRGHALTPGNLYRRGKRGGRQCRLCTVLWHLRRAYSK